MRFLSLLNYFHDFSLLSFRFLQAGMEIERLRVPQFFHYYHSKSGLWGSFYEEEILTNDFKIVNEDQHVPPYDPTYDPMVRYRSNVPLAPQMRGNWTPRIDIPRCLKDVRILKDRKLSPLVIPTRTLWFCVVSVFSWRQRYTRSSSAGYYRALSCFLLSQYGPFDPLFSQCFYCATDIIHCLRVMAVKSRITSCSFDHMISLRALWFNIFKVFPSSHKKTSVVLDFLLQVYVNTTKFIYILSI